MTNIILDIIFVKILGMGVSGVAIATNISQFISCILALRFLMSVSDAYKVCLNKIKVHKETAIKIVKIGLPTGVQSMVVSLSNVLIQSSVNTFGASVMAGFGAYLKIDGFNILPVLSLGMASTTFTGQNCGARKKERVKKGLWITIVMGVVYTVIIGILLLIFAQPIMQLFTQDEKIIDAGIRAMKYFCPFYALLSILHSLVGAVRGAGKTMPPMIILLFSMCIFRIIWLQFILPMNNTIDNIYVLYPVSWAIGVILMGIYIWKAKWL